MFTIGTSRTSTCFLSGYLTEPEVFFFFKKTKVGMRYSWPNLNICRLKFVNLFFIFRAMMDELTDIHADRLEYILTD